MMMTPFCSARCRTAFSVGVLKATMWPFAVAACSTSDSDTGPTPARRRWGRTSVLPRVGSDVRTASTEPETSALIKRGISLGPTESRVSSDSMVDDRTGVGLIVRLKDFIARCGLIAPAIDFNWSAWTGKRDFNTDFIAESADFCPRRPGDDGLSCVQGTASD